MCLEMDKEKLADILKKEYIGTKVNYMGKPLHIENIRYAKNIGKILAYNKNGWCCDVETLRTSDNKSFLMDSVKVKE